MRQELQIRNAVDEKGLPAGGHVSGIGIWIEWQDGPLGRGEERAEPNGAFVEGVIEAAIHRLNFYQTTSAGRFACDENAEAIMYLKSAVNALEERTREREGRGVEGTHEA